LFIIITSYQLKKTWLLTMWMWIFNKQMTLGLKSNLKFKMGNLLWRHWAWMIKLSIKESFNPIHTLISKASKNLSKIKKLKLSQKLRPFSKLKLVLRQFNWSENKRSILKICQKLFKSLWKINHWWKNK